MGKSTARHPQRRVIVNGHGAMVDADLAELLRETWRAGIETVSSCQDAGETTADLVARYPHIAAYREARRGWSYVDFAAEGDVTDFFTRVVAGGPSAELRHRMRHWLAEGHWHTSVSIAEQYHDPSLFFAFMYQLSFPHSDIDEITACLKRGREVLIT